MANNMDIMTSSPLMSAIADIRTVYNRIGADIVIFLVAMLAYLVLHRVKTRHGICKTKAACKESLVDNNECIEVQDMVAPMHTEQVTLEEEEATPFTLASQNHCTDATYNLQIQALIGSPEQARVIVSQVLDRPVGSAFSFDLVLAILGFCRMSFPDRPLADKLFEIMNKVDIEVLSEFIHFYLDTNQFEKACDVFELNFATFFEKELDEETEWSLMHAALKCGRHSVANHLFETSQVDAVRHVSKIQEWWRHSCRSQVLSLHDSSREAEISEIFGRLAHVFNERFPFHENGSDHSGDESTVCLGDDDCISDASDSDSEWNSDYY